MTASWPHFLDQYNAQGPEKAEGYTAAHFAGLDPGEQLKAAELLRAEIEGSPSAACNGLVLLGGPFAEKALLRFVRERGDEPIDNVDHVYYALWKLTGDPGWREEMIAAYPLAWDIARAGFVLRLCEEPPSAASEAFLERCAAEDSEPSARSLAGQELMKLHAPGATPEERAAMIAVFLGDDAAARDGLVRRLVGG